MAKTPISDEELKLRKRARRRLVGAIVLVLLMVVLVPMVLDRAPRPQKQDIDIKIPPVPGQTDAPPIPPAPQPGSAQQPAASPAESTPPKPVDPSPPVSPSPAPPTTTVAAPERSAAVDANAPSSTPANAKRTDTEPANEEGYVIQVGAFSDPANAKHLLQKLKAQKVPAYSEPVSTPKGEKTRVRAGPYPSIEAAEKGRERLKTLNLLPPGEAKIARKGE